MTIDQAYKILNIPAEDRLHPHLAAADERGMPQSMALDRWRKQVLTAYVSTMYAEMVTDRASDRHDVIEATHQFDDAVEILTHLIP